jgi:hypothetical protein
MLRRNQSWVKVRHVIVIVILVVVKCESQAARHVFFISKA